MAHDGVRTFFLESGHQFLNMSCVKVSMTYHATLDKPWYWTIHHKLWMLEIILNFKHKNDDRLL